MLQYIFGVELPKQSFSTRTPQHTAEDSTLDTTVPRCRSIAVTWRTAGRDRVGQEQYLDAGRHHYCATSK